MSDKEYNNVFFTKGAAGRIIKEYFPKIYVKVGEQYQFKGLSALEAISENEEEVIANNMVKQQRWGNGDKEFVRTLYNWAVKKNMNFFDDCLEPLFYQTLNRNRGEMAYCQFLHCRIPFLNGGLFEQLDNYDWKNNNFNIPNSIFSNKDGKGRNADGILDIFDRYNFTMNEDEPMEREVAIDPEMLGKVFENLLDVKDRKSKGAFYTPREIVHYMCQETLINHMVSKTGISESAIRDFILYGEYLRDEDTIKTLKVADDNGKQHYEFDKNKELLISEEILSFKNGVNRLNELDELLANVKVADLAVGSGAFPLGMLNEIVKARQVLTEYLAIEMNGFQKKSFYAYERKPYDLKVNTIKNCIFACDIAKLRLWLSIVIDDVIVEDAGNGDFDAHSKPRQLPNLECNIICGNSLVDEFKGNKLITESVLLNNVSENSQQTMFQQGVDGMLSKLIELQDELFFAKEHNDKEEIKADIQRIYDNIILEQLQGNSELIDAYYDTKNEPSKPFVLWQLYFPRVFKENGGFDIVIGNPPYIQLQKAVSEHGDEKLGNQYQTMGYETFVKTGDIYCLFYEKGNRLLKKGGFLAFITSNKWMRAGYGKNLRNYFSVNTNPIVLIDFAGQKIFETATVDVNILIFENTKNKGMTKACIVDKECRNNLSVFVQQASSITSYESDNSWTILSSTEINIKAKIDSIGTPLKDWNIKICRGILTGFNEAFIISGAKKEELIAEDPKSAEIIRPILRGRDIKRYEYTFADLWVIAAHNGVKSQNVLPININDYPAIKQHLDQYYEKLATRADKGNTPYNLRNCVYMDDFSKQKIIWGEISDKPKFAIDTTGQFVPEATTFLMVGSHLKYLLCFLNSSVSEYFFAKYGTTTGMGTLRWKKYLIELLPIPKVALEQEQQVIELLDKLLIINAEEKQSLIHKIDNVIYNLFNLNSNEIAFIEQAIEQGAH